MGREEFLRGLRQAYCATMRSLERKNFLTIEDVFRYQDQLHISELSRQLDRQKSESIRLLAQNADLSAAISDLQSRLQTLEQSAGARQLQEFESLLNECMAETDALKKGISSLCERLYCTWAPVFTPMNQNRPRRFRSWRRPSTPRLPAPPPERDNYFFPSYCARIASMLILCVIQ